MFKNLLKKSTPLKLGRWGVTYEASVLEKRINWANHDHCGSEVCENNFIKDNKTKNKTKQPRRNFKYKLDPLLPFCM
jgi:hypothetical protein|tara:strand:- start:6326 stop:6556 length:231 start_codon:yes stop_codon:yes gene_type:complete